ncbi:endonuclease/exonuclease/phosphatase family protein [Trifolium medium]|uniref:Endonuclease/exonuclease/phosphatase family protein n=1 Tax=Trifolium medium TaxID=97028 RepID=A0A392LZC8_9FABA|nr:endonuclease/exonuclease/phosphatase family protein [Trifolium medium]
MMREKVERDALGGSRFPRAGGGVRLTEFDSKWSDGFVKRLDREATSFFFTNFPEESLAVDLWKLFAKFGRVGEVFIPKKLDKRGCRFGFVKFMEVKNVEELGRNLEEVWLGSFKLRVNLSRFAKGSSKDHPKSAIIKQNRGGLEVVVQPGKSFKSALAENRPESSLKETSREYEVASGRKGGMEVGLVVEPEVQFLHILQQSFVGRLVNGGEIKTLQLNLCMEGHRDVKVAALGGGSVIIFGDTGIELQQVLSNDSWWKGVLADIVPWSPNRIPNRRDIWVNIYGVPLQCWGEMVFRMVTEGCGEYQFMDEDTSNKLRLDVARVKLSCPILGTIDVVVPVVVEGVSSVVRVIEERGCVFEGDRNVNEDQMRWCAAASSCKSFDQGPAMAMVGESVFEDSDSDGTEGGQTEVQATKETATDTQGFVEVPTHTLVPQVSRRATSSKVGVEGVHEGDKEVGVSEEVGRVRGLTSLVEGDGKGRVESDQVIVGPVVRQEDVDLVSRDEGVVGPTVLGVNVLAERISSPIGLSESGPNCLGVSQEVRPEGKGGGGSGSGKPILKSGQPMSVNLDNMLMGHVINQTGLVDVIPGDTVSIISSQSLEKENGVFLKTGSRPGVVKHRKTLIRPNSLPLIGAPKCLRFAEAVVASSRNGKQRKATSLDEGVVWSAGKLMRGKSKARVEVTREEKGSSCSLQNGQNEQHAYVGSTSSNNEASQSGVNWLLCEDSLDDVDSYVESKKHPKAIAAEAEFLFEIQQDLGLNLVCKEIDPEAHMVEMENRDQLKMVMNEEAQHVQ